MPIELNWLCKHMKKVRGSQLAIPCAELSKTQLFPVTIVKFTISFQLTLSSNNNWVDKIVSVFPPICYLFIGSNDETEFVLTSSEKSQAIRMNSSISKFPSIFWSEP